MADVNKFVEETLQLLTLEREAELNEARAFCESADHATLEKKGVCLRKLVVLSRRTGLYGRTLLTFGKRKTQNTAESSLPAHCITPGDIVGLSYSSNDNNVSELSSGIVTRVLSSSLVVAFDESLDSQLVDEDALMRLTRLANNITHKRMKSALETLCNVTSYPCSHMVDVLFGVVSMGEPLNLSSLLRKPECHVFEREIFFNENLNQSQREAVQFALTRQEVGVIHGPPGTGKTTTVVEVIVQAVKNCHLKILACAPSNIAVDNIVEKLAKYKIKADIFYKSSCDVVLATVYGRETPSVTMTKQHLGYLMFSNQVVRLGHPARVSETIHGYSLDAILDSSDGTAIVKDVRKDIDVTQKKLKTSRNPGERARLRTEIKTLRRELREREEKALKQILLNADVILSTNVSASDDGPLKHVPRDHFDLVIIDEAAQSLEAACWIPLLWGSRCILAGDHQQLPPTIVSRKAAKEGLETTLMERAVKLLGDTAVHMLTTQYRMNQAIMKWSSEQLYNGRLIADNSVSEHLLRDLPQVRDSDITTVPLMMIDTAGCDLYELQTPEEESKGNEGEAEVVAQHVEALINSGVKHKDIGIITPYNLQVELLRSRLSTRYPSLEIKSVDGFQGREKEAIVISLVRSNNEGEIGFLSENRRINVAVTRARRHLTVVGDSNTVSRDPFLNTLLEYISESGEVWSAEQYRCQISGSSVLRGTGTRIVSQRTVCGKSRQENTKANKRKTNDKKDEKFVDKNGDKMNSTKLKEPGENRSWKGEKAGRLFKRDTDDMQGESRKKKDSEQKRENLEKQIKAFLKDVSRSELKFSVDLTSEERFLVHCIAEELGVGHVSMGTGEERFIVVSKPMATMATMASANDISHNAFGLPEKQCEALANDVAKGQREETCSSCEKRIPSSNMSLHQVRCQGEKQLAQGNVSQKTTRQDKKKSNKKGSKSPVAKVPVEKNEDGKGSDNLDELLAEFKRKDSQCALPGCKKSILTVGQKCRCCESVYCLGHHIPEVHGCTQAARELAKREIQAKPIENHRPTSSKTATKKVHLHRKLETKLKDLEEKRKPKQNSEDKK